MLIKIGCKHCQYCFREDNYNNLVYNLFLAFGLFCGYGSQYHYFEVSLFSTMYISRRSATVRNVSISTVNGGITLVILLIAPLGLAAVIINTMLVAVATYIVASAADK